MKPLKVSELTAYINKILKTDYLLQGVVLEGEISQAKQYPSGHLYLTLKDEESQIQGIMYKWSVKNLDFEPKHGMNVTVKGQVQCYEQAGKLQINITEMFISGQGALHQEFLKRKEKLASEGIFDVERKKRIPDFPKKIGLVTSLKAAALGDFLQIAKRRNPAVDILISPSLVQGDQAPGSLIRALEKFDNRNDIDLIVVTRGGGSLEDLWAFNDEKLVRKIFSMEHPVVSAVGHEIDFTLTDFVADLRASTPSAAAELVVSDRREMVQNLDRVQNSIQTCFDYRLMNEKRSIESQKIKIETYLNRNNFILEKMNLKGLSFELNQVIQRNSDRIRGDSLNLYRLMDPRQILHKISNDVWKLDKKKSEINTRILGEIQDLRINLDRIKQELLTSSEQIHLHKVKSGRDKILTSARQAKVGDEILVEFYDGAIQANVISIRTKGEAFEL